MDEYIDLEAALREIERRERLMVGDKTISVDALKRFLLNRPAADVVPVIHGRWISLTECANEGVYCSICKKKIWQSDYARCSKKSRNKLRSNYCPNCGAKMDGGNE